MANYVRNNAWNNGGDFSNPDLLWYARGVQAMMDRPLNDPTSWWFYAAIHGEYVNPATAWYSSGGTLQWPLLIAPPKVPVSPLPAQDTMDLYWNQCQHGTWYFTPWHRGYLMALEAQLRKDIVSKGGPDTWALPYWNYFGGQDGSQYQLPPAFATQTLPDGSPNPLYVVMRYGPEGDSNIYVPTPAGAAAHPEHSPYRRGEASEKALADDLFTGTDAVTKLPGFGGPDTGFAHSSGYFGNLESDPHNLVHVYVGGTSKSNPEESGLMSDPGTAALDPIFYLHHGNIDRLWAEWNALGNTNPTAPSWLDGPAQQFVMPGTNGQPWYYTPAEVTDLDALNYRYQELAAPAARPVPMLAERLALLGAPADAANRAPVAQAVPKQPELLGASAGPLRIQGISNETLVKLDTGEQRKTVRSFSNFIGEQATAARGATNAAPAPLPDKAFLKLESVRGTSDATVLSVYVSAPATGTAPEGEQLLAGHAALFGMRRASVQEGQHGGEGLTIILDITPVIDQLHLANTLDVSSLQVNIVPNRPLSDKATIQVGRISIYRQAF